MNDVFSEIGPSKVSLEATNPMAPSPWNSFWFPSFKLISRTEDNLPPYLAGNPPLMSLTSLMASALNTEKNPKRWLALYTGTPSRSIRFWSGEPPLT